MMGEGLHTPYGHFVHKAWRGTVESPSSRFQAYLAAAKEIRIQPWLPTSLGVEGSRGPRVQSWLMAWWGPSKMGLESCLLAP